MLVKLVALFLSFEKSMSTLDALRVRLIVMAVLH
jgi:hypothetical protein